MYRTFFSTPSLYVAFEESPLVSPIQVRVPRVAPDLPRGRGARGAQRGDAAGAEAGPEAGDGEQ